MIMLQSCSKRFEPYRDSGENFFNVSKKFFKYGIMKIEAYPSLAGQICGTACVFTDLTFTLEINIC